MNLTNNGRVYVSGPLDVFNFFGREMQALEKEVVKLICLDPENMVVNFETVSDGVVDMTLLRPRDVFEIAFKNSAASMVLVHNHPSGSPHPSESDIKVTKKIARMGKLIGIRLQDHVIIGSCGYVSLKALGVIS